MKRWLWILALLASPLEAQITPDTVTVYVLGRARRVELDCPLYGFVGDTINCRVWAVDSAGERTVATFSVNSSSPAVVQPVTAPTTDTILRLRLLSRGVAQVIVTAQPTAVIIGGVLHYRGGAEQFAPAATWTTGETDSLRLCGYSLAGRDTLGKSWSTCPGRAPVTAFHWEWSEEPAEIRQALVSWRARSESLERAPVAR